MLDVFLLVDIGYCNLGRRRRTIEDGFQDPRPSPNRTGPVRKGRQCHDSTAGQHSTPYRFRLILPTKLNSLPIAVATSPRLDSIMLRHPIVHVGVVGIDQVKNRTIFSENRLEQQEWLAEHVACKRSFSFGPIVE